MLQGVLLDMDGVIFDTERIIVEIEHEAIREMGYAITMADQMMLGGLADDAYNQALLSLFGQGFDLAHYRHIAEQRKRLYFRSRGVPKMKGLDVLLQYLKENEYRVAVASSAQRERIIHHLNQAGILHSFDTIVAGNMVGRSKPDPEIYQTAARLLGLKPEQCAAVEDSKNGLRSANAAGCVTIMIPDIYPPDNETRSLCHGELGSLAELPAWLEAYNSIQPRQLAFGETGLL